jgi:DNA-binding FrmR family transcriptional regulator
MKEAIVGGTSDVVDASDEIGLELQSRLATVRGHLEGVAGMIASGSDCGDVLHQLSAVAGSVAALQRVVTERHVRQCISRQLDRGEVDTAIAAIMDLLLGGPRPARPLGQGGDPTRAQLPKA